MRRPGVCAALAILLAASTVIAAAAAAQAVAAPPSTADSVALFQAIASDLRDRRVVSVVSRLARSSVREPCDEVVRQCWSRTAAERLTSALAVDLGARLVTPAESRVPRCPPRGDPVTAATG